MTSPVVAYCGNFRSPESTENHWKYAFESLGARFHAVQQDTASEDEWEAAASEADLALWSTTWGWPLPAHRKTWERINARGVRTASLHLDLIIGLAREREVLDGQHPQFFGPEIVWTSDGSHDEKWSDLGVPHRWLAPAIHEPNALIGVARPEYEARVCFTGSVKGYHVEHKRRQELIEQARHRWPGRQFRIYGPDHDNAIRGPALADVYASAEVVIGDSLCLNGPQDLYLSDRVPTCAGAGGLLLHPWNQATSHFMPAAIWTDWNVTDQLDEVERILEWSDEEKHAFRMAAHHHVVECHTYGVRARMVLDAFGL